MGIASNVVKHFSAADLAEDLKFSKMDAMALKELDTDWCGSLAEAFTQMENSNVPTTVVEKAYEIVSGQAETREQLQDLGVNWMKCNGVPLAAIFWFEQNTKAKTIVS
jgi:hypothetical protein